MQDISYIIIWWLMLTVIGAVSFPISWKMFGKFVDKGYGLAKILGILILSYPIFLLGILKILPFSQLTLVLVISVYTLVNIALFVKNKKDIIEDVKNSLRPIVISEILFAFGLFFWSLVRAYQPDINGLEKFMDLGFTNAILRTDYLPATDMWFAGEVINYYWFGHFISAFLTKLSSLASSITYNLLIATVLGFSLTATFSIVSTLTNSVLDKKNVKLALASGLISAILLNFAGNFHVPFFYLRQTVKNIEVKITCNGDPTCITSRIDERTYWYPDATRFIGYDPETEDKTIHEFPLYSYVVSDLHAHLINLPFVLLFLALLIRHVLAKYKDSKIRVERYFPLGFSLGVFFMTNAWDTANYLLTASVLLGITNLHRQITSGKVKLLNAFFKAFVESVLSVVLIIGVAIVVVLPFLLKFESLAQGIDFVNARSPLWQLAVLWGFPATLTIIFVSSIKLRFNGLKSIKPADLIVISLLVSSWILIIIPEIYYVKDIYIASHHRANTMFKLTYQAYVMTYLTSGYIAIRVIKSVNGIWARIAVFSFFGIIFTSILQYPRLATNSYYGNLENYKGLRGDTWIETRYPSQYAVISWFNQTVDGQPVILEAPGDSYTEYNMISSYTGLPTVSGWYVHEWLWRGDSSFPAARVADVQNIYTSTDIQLTKDLLTKYNVEYVIIGTFEREKFPSIYEEKFSDIGDVVFASEDTKVYQLR